MQLSELWLRSLVNPALDSMQLAHLLTMAGLEVEANEPVAPPFSNVVVAQVLDVGPHPNADRLRVTRVDAGTGVSLQIVCGAPNVSVGQRVPCALVGAQLPGGLGIGLTTVRGVESHGMLCSAKELGLNQDAEGLLVLPENAPVGTDLRIFLALEDRVFTLKLTPNRADCLGVLGIARDVAALTDAPLTPPDCRAVTAAIRATFPVTLVDPLACGRFTGRVINGVNPKAPTPLWMKQRLERSGVRSISAIVDVTNYVMLELSRPLHAYDLAKLQDGIQVRWAVSGEVVNLLNGQTVTLDSEYVVVADASGAIGLAGIMGGSTTEIDASTVDIFLESAFFPPDAIAGRPRRLGFTSDAAHRFERGVDFESNVAGIERATRLILEICGGQAGPTRDTIAKLPTRDPVRLRSARAERLLGVSIGPDRIAKIFAALDFSFTRNVQDFVVTPPSFRFDIAIEEDLIEEIVRIDGYEKLPATPPKARLAALSTPETLRPAAKLKQMLAARDYQEVITFSFVPSDWERDFSGNPSPVCVQNPIANHLAVMRSSFIGSMIEVLRTNLSRKTDRVRIFEIGRRFLSASTDERCQPLTVAGLAYGDAVFEQWGEEKRRVDFFDVKGDLEALLLPHRMRAETSSHQAFHPGRSARVFLAESPVGWIGELHPRWMNRYELPLPPVLFELDLQPLIKVRLPHARDISKFPSVRRDVAFLLQDQLSAQEVIDVMQGSAPACVTEIRLFDVYRGPNLPLGQKSLAILVLMQDTQRTLTDTEVDAAMAAMISRVKQNLGASLRQ